MRSRFAIIGALGALLLALLYVAPVFASQGWSRVDGQGDDYLGVVVLDPAAGNLSDPAFVHDAGASLTDDSDDVMSRHYLRTGLPADWGTAQTAAKYTKVGNTLWVAAASSTPWGDDTSAAGSLAGAVPYSLVYIDVTFRTAPTTGATVTADVRNVTSGRSITGGDLTRFRASDDTSGGAAGEPNGPGTRNDFDSPLYRGRLMLHNGTNNVGDGSTTRFTGYFFVTKTQMNLPGGQPSIVGGENDIIRITIDGKTRDVKVDATAPTISGTGPAHNTIQTGTSATFTGTITDTGSGIAPDVAGEDDTDVGGSTTNNGDLDGDGVTAEPRSLTSPQGASRDIDINMGTEPPELPDVSGEAGTGWTAVTNGFRFAFTRAGLVTTSGDVHWNVVAKDRVNNRAQTDANASMDSRQDYLLKIDGSNPGIGKVEAGRGYNPSTKKTVPNASSIKLTFTNNGNAPTGDGGNADWLEAGSVDEADFRVEASRSSSATLAIASVLHPNHGPDDDGAEDTRNVVYITLEEPLSSNAQPEVNLIGTIRDLAGRAAPPEAKEAQESIAPSLSVVVTGAPDVRPVAKGTSTDKVIIRVSSDEELVRVPSVYLVSFKLNASGEVVVDGAPTSVAATVVLGAVNTWEAQATSSSSGLRGVYVRGVDRAIPANMGMTGGITTSGADGMPVDGDKADLTKMTLFEFDNALPAPEFTLTPSTTTGGRSTESSSPFVRIDFAEDREYDLSDEAASDPTTTDGVEFGTPPVRVEVDSHNGVTLTKLTITDSAGVSTDLLGQEGSVDVNSFIVALSDLEKGTYTLHVNGTDAAGNARAQDAAYALSVVERAAFKVSLSPGWNLVSVPGDPSDPSLDAVLPSSHPATMVLSYAPADPDGPWLTATRSAGMDWSDNASNTLTEIGAGHGYWINTNAFVGISTLIDERSAASVPPTYEVLEGWNLLGVTDVTLQQSGTEVSVETYLASSPWSIAYTFDTQSNTWTKHAKGGEDTKVKIGQGMWVYMTADGALAP